MTLRTPSGRKSAGILKTLKNVDIICIFDPPIDPGAMGKPVQPESQPETAKGGKEIVHNDAGDKSRDPALDADDDEATEPEIEPEASQEAAQGTKRPEPGPSKPTVPLFHDKKVTKSMGKKSGKAKPQKPTKSKPYRTKPDHDWYVIDTNDQFKVKVATIMSK